MLPGLHNGYSPTLVRFTTRQGLSVCLSESDQNRYWAKVDKSAGPHACWLWTASVCGGKEGRRYGQFAVSHPDGTPRKQLHLYAHRIAWIVAHGQIPNDQEICHSCHNSRCCNVSHIHLGTHAENNRESADAGHFHAPRPSRHKVTAEQLAEIDRLLAAGTKQVDVARQFGVTKAWVCSYAKGKRRQFDRPRRKERAA